MAATAKKLKYQIYRADKNSFHVASVLLTGEKEAVLIDAQFTRSDAQHVVDQITASGKALTAVYISHGDPDYYFGLEIIKKSFPDAVVYATEQTIDHIKKTSQKKLETWGPKLGENGTKNVVLPQVLQGNSLKLEGEAIEIKGLDGASPGRTYVWVPSLRAILGGVNVYGDLHLWIADAGTEEKRAAWTNILDEMESLHPELVVPAHALNDDDLSDKSIRYSKEYLKVYESEEPKAGDSAALIQAMDQRYPSSGLAIALELGAKVSKGEMSW